MPVRTFSAWFGYFRCHYIPISGANESMRDQEWITTNILDLIISKVSCVSCIRHARNQRAINFLVKQNSVPDLFLLGPFGEFIFSYQSFSNLFEYLDWHLDLSSCRNVYEPFPKLRYTLQRIIIAVCVYENVGVKEE